MREVLVREVLKITGMTCAACSGRLEKAVGGAEGVKSCVVNLATERMTVEYDGSVTDLDAIKKRIEKCGFGWTENKQTDMDGFRKLREVKVLRLKLLIAVIFALPLMYIGMGHMLPFGWTLPVPHFLNHNYNPLNFTLAQLFLTLPIVAAGYRFYSVGFKTFAQRSPNMDSLIAIGTSAAMLYSLYATFMVISGETQYHHELYYETAGMIITLILCGKIMEARSKGKTGEAIKKLIGLRPKTAVIVKDGREIEIQIEDVGIGDIVLVKPGGSVPVDGVVTEGRTSIDEAMLTGESMPVDKKPGDLVYAASINKNGTIKFRAERVGEETALARIIKLVEDAQSSKPPIAQMADRVCRVFVPVVLAVALLAFVVWLIVTRDLNFSLTIFVTVLVIACPCALGLATPTSIMVGTGKGAENGILIKGGEALETAHKVQAVVLDKTGTITEGRPEVTDIIASINEKRLLRLAASAEKGSEHPLGEAIVRAAEKENLEFLEAEDFEALTGRGIRCVIEGQEILAGNIKLMEKYGIEAGEYNKQAERLANEGKTPMYIAADRRAAGLIAVADVVKPTSAMAVKKLTEMGIIVYMLTGDNRRTADAIARSVGIKNVLAEVLPGDKAEEVKKLQAKGCKTAMVGDGINDAPALAQADVGIAIGSGTDVAMESAEIVLMHSDLNDAPTAIRLSKATMKNIKQNLFWAFAYNTAGIPLAAGALYLVNGMLMSPVFAAAAMSLSSVSVLANALRLRRFR